MPTTRARSAIPTARYHPQVKTLTEVARECPEVKIVLNHFGGPLRVGPYRRDEVFPGWRADIRELAICPNVYVKLGGLAMIVNAFDFHVAPLPPSSGELANAWRPYVETCIEALGANRCMFASNFSVDKGARSYPVLFNAFKRLASGASASEKVTCSLGPPRASDVADIVVLSLGAKPADRHVLDQSSA